MWVGSKVQTFLQGLKSMLYTYQRISRTVTVIFDSFYELRMVLVFASSFEIWTVVGLNHKTMQLSITTGLVGKNL